MGVELVERSKSVIVDDVLSIEVDGRTVGEIEQKVRESSDKVRFHAVLNLPDGDIIQGFGCVPDEALIDAFHRDREQFESKWPQIVELAKLFPNVEIKRPVLMTAENPTGFKLEDLLFTLQCEVEAKNEKILSDESALSLKVQANNLKILECLGEAERLQRDSYARLSEKSADEGPGGVARIGG